MIGFDRAQFAPSLESAKSLSAVKPQTQPLDFSLHIFETLPSTNQKLWELIDRGASEGTAVIAIQQQAGRGQWGRQWQSPPGGLYLSLSLAPHLPAQLAAQLTICGAWGIATILREYDLPVSLKWPNDLALSGRKLGGILTETRVKQGFISKAVVGVGINLTNPVPENGINLQSFQRKPSSPILSLETLAAITLVGIASGYYYWQQEGIDTLLPSYQNLLINMGRSIQLEGRQGVVVGVCSDGNLRVNLYPQGAAPSEEISIKPGTISLGYE